MNKGIKVGSIIVMAISFTNILSSLIIGAIFVADYIAIENTNPDNTLHHLSLVAGIISFICAALFIVSFISTHCLLSLNKNGCTPSKRIFWGIWLILFGYIFLGIIILSTKPESKPAPTTE